MIRAWIGLFLLLPLLGCLVLESTYQAEVVRRKGAEEQLEKSLGRVQSLQQTAGKLRGTKRNLELERESLGEERVKLIGEIEDLRLARETLARELAAERKKRETREAEIKDVAGTYQSLVDQLESEVESGKLEIDRLQDRLQVRALEQILFDSGRAGLKPQGREVLAKVATELRKVSGYTIHVEGHTDSMPITGGRYPSNWELAAARASGVVRFLIDQGLDPAKLMATAYAEFKPIADNKTAEGRARNRRIEIVLVPETTE